MRTTRKTNQSESSPLGGWQKRWTLSIVFCLIPGMVLAEQRTWISADGKNQVQAELVGTSGKVVILKKESDQKLHLVPLSTLSKADQEFVRQKYPLIFDADQSKPAQSTAENNPKQSPTTMTREKTSQATDQQQNRFNWQRATQVLPGFQPFLIEGTAALGETTGMMNREQRGKWKDTGKQIGALLSYLADPETFEDLARKLEQKGSVGAFNSTTGVERERLIECFWLFQDLHQLFYPLQEKIQYRDLSQSKINEFDKGIQIAKFVSKVHATFEQLKYHGEEIPLSLFTRATVGNYNEAAGEFPVTVRGSYLQTSIGGRINAIYINPPDKPTSIKKTPDEARTFARQLEGKDLVFKQDVLLSQPRFEQDPRSSTLDNVRLINVKMQRLSLVTADNPGQVFHRWEFEYPLDKILQQPKDSAVDAKGKAGLARKMQTLARQHRLNVVDGYPVIRIDEKIAYQKNHIGSDHNRFSLLLDRVALGLDSTYVNPELIARHFPETIGRYVRVATDRRGEIQSADWKGTNEFDKRATQRAFQQAYDQKLRDYAIQLPIRFVEVYAIPLGLYGKYDFEREGVFIEHDGYHRRFPELTTSYRIGKARTIKQLINPCFVQEFVPIATAQARSLFSQAVERNNDAYVSRVVTWDRIQMPSHDAQKLPPVLVSRDSFQLFRDSMLKQSLTRLESKLIPPPFLSEAEDQVFPGPDQPLDLDQYSLYFLKQEVDGQKPPAAELAKLFEAYRFRHKSLASEARSAIHNLTLMEKEYSAYGTARNGIKAGTAEKKARTIQRWKAARQQVDQFSQSNHSSFFPLGIDQLRLDAKLMPDLIEKWQKWMSGSIDSSQRHFVVHAEVKLDPQIRDVQLTVSHKSPVSPYTWNPTKTLIDQGIPADRLVILNYQDSNLILPLIPCLQMEEPLDRSFAQIPDEVRDQIIARMNHRARIEFVVAVGDVSILPDGKTDRRGGLLMKSELKGFRLFNDEELLFEQDLSVARNNKTKTESPVVSGNRNTLPAANVVVPEKSEITEPLTPASSLFLISRYLPEFTQQNSGIIMLNRWRQETDFRRSGEKSVYGLVPERGMYFRSQTSQPTVQQMKAESDAFLKWLREPRRVPGNRYTLRFSTRFTEYASDVKGYRRALLRAGDFSNSMSYGQVLNHVGSEINLAQRRIEANASMRKMFPQRPNSGGSGGGGGIRINGLPQVQIPRSKTPAKTGTLTESEKEKQKLLLNKIEELTRLKQYLQSAPPVFYLHHLGNHFGLANLRGNLQAYGTSNAEVARLQKTHEPIFPVLQLSHEIVLPQSLNIKPEKLEWDIEIEFQVKSASSQETPPELFDPERLGEQKKWLKGQKDHGQYALFEIEVSGAWLIDKTTKTRAQSLKLIPVSKKPGQKPALK